MQFVDPANAQMRLQSIYGPSFMNHHNYASVQNPSLITPSSSSAAASTSTSIPNIFREFRTSATNNQLNGNVSPRQDCVASTSSQVSTHGIMCQMNLSGNSVRHVGYFPDGIYSNTVPQGTSSPSFTSTEQELNLLGNSSQMSGQVSSSCNNANPTVISSYVRPQTDNFRGNQSVDQQNTKAYLLIKNQQLLIMLHHAMVCRKKEPCVVEKCAQFKILLEHAVDCKSKTCTTRCSVTQKMIKHITGCHNPMCQLCGPVRESISNKGARIDKDKSNRYDSAASGEPEPKRVRTDHHYGLLYSVGTDMKNGHDTKEVCDGESTKELRAQSVIAKDLGCSVNEATKEPKVESVKNVYSFVNNATTETGVKTEMDEKSAKEDKVNTAELVAISESDNEVGTEPVEQVKDDDSLNSISENGMIVELAKNEDCCASETMEETTNQTVRGASLLDTFTPEEINIHLSSLRLCEKTQVTNEQEHLLQVEDQNTCSLCGKEELPFAPPSRYCGKCSVLIPSQGVYYCTGETGNKDREFQSSVPISLCSKCYNVSGELVKLPSGDTPKVCFDKRYNYAQTDADSEWWVHCSKCEAWQHQICALFNGRRNQANVEYTCATCFLKEIENGECKSLVPIKVLGAHGLPRTMLSDHIEKWLFTHLDVEREERAANEGKKVEEVPRVEGLCVRVVSSVDRVAYVKRNFQEFLKDENYPSEFPYKSKAIVLFQKIEGVDVCLFVMYVQEYGSQYPLPNQRHTYISYIDSVKYFRPDVKLKTSTGNEALRTFVYHEILIAYLDYCKKRGFTSCSLWACPPMKHDDYILYCHPVSQRMPKDEKLRAWYQAMIAKALKENVVVERTNLYDYYLIPANDWKTSVSAAHLPYCDNDFWPEQAEVILSGSPKKEAEPKGRAVRAAKRGLMDGKPDDIMLLHKLGERMRSLKDNFILMYLQPTCKHCRRAIVSATRWVCTSCKNFLLCDQCYNEEEELPPKDKCPAISKLKHEFRKVNELALPATDDPDPCRECEFFDSRIDLLRLCQTKLYQFDTLRRVKHSTMMILHHLHTPACSSCHTELEPDDILWRCPTCPGYYLCSSCYGRGVWEFAHDHELVRLGEKVTDTVMETHIENADDTKLTLTQICLALSKKFIHQRGPRPVCIFPAGITLVHASQCINARCNHKYCRKMKLLFRHGVRCKVRQSGGCLMCKKVWNLLRIHSCSCEDQDCKISRCKEIKDHISKLYLHSVPDVDVKT